MAPRDSQTFTIKVRQQLSRTKDIYNAQYLFVTLASLLKTSLLLEFFLSFLSPSSSSLFYILTLIRSLQLIVHLPLLSTTFPSNISLFFSELAPLCTYDVLPSFLDELFDKEGRGGYNAEQQLEVSEVFERIRAYGYYNDRNVFTNIRTILLFITIYYIRLAILMLIWPIKEYI